MHALLIQAALLWARGGGAGGGHGGGGGSHSSGGGFGGGGFGGGGVFIPTGGGSGGGGDFSFWVVVLFIITIILIRYFSKRMNAGGGGGDPDDGASDIDLLDRMRPVNVPLAQDQVSQLSQKVQIAFLTVQKCWSEKTLAPMRRFITDGVYQRFNAQFTMMNILGQTNTMSDVEVRNLKVVAYSVDGDYENVDIAIKAFADDQFVCEKYPTLNSPGGAEEFGEVWSFIRRRDYLRAGDIFHALACPKCGANLTNKLVETARCPYCDVYLNSGEFDWVLSEITQVADYGSNSALLSLQEPSLPRDIEVLRNVFPAFSTHVLEDRASNAFMQILIALATRKIDVLKRFMTPAGFEKAKSLMSPEHVAYNRLYIADTCLLSIESEGNNIRAHVGVEYFSQFVVLGQGSARAIDHEAVGSIRVVTFVHEMTGQIAKGNIFANACSKCGASQTDSLSMVCAYCGASLNDPKLDWVAENILEAGEFRDLMARQ